MHTFIAISGEETFRGALPSCLDWSIKQIKKDKGKVAKIFHARGGEKEMKVVTEVTQGGVRLIPHGRRTHIRKFDKQ